MNATSVADLGPKTDPAVAVPAAEQRCLKLLRLMALKKQIRAIRPEIDQLETELFGIQEGGQI